MDDALSLGVFGCLHADDLEKVESELDSFRRGGDAIFIEYPTQTTFGAGEPSDILRYPLELLAYLLLTLVHGPLYLLFNRDLFTTEYVAAARIREETDLSIHRVDTPFLHLPRGPAAVVGNWLVLAVFFWLAPTAVGLAVSAILAAGFVPGLARRFGRRPGVLTAAVVWTGAYAVFFWQFTVILAGFGFVLVAVLCARLAVAHEYRNDRMVGRIRTLAAEHDYENAVLLTGRAHVRGIVEQAREHGLDVDRAHLSKWRSEGDTLDSVTLDALEERTDADFRFVNPFGRPEANQQLVSPAPPQSVLRRRVGASLLDFCLAALLAVSVSDSLWGGVTAVGGPAPRTAQIATGVVVALSYYALFEAVWATTAGKRLFGLFVADEDGTTPTTTQTVVRTILRPFDLVFGLFLIAGTSHQRRLGDLAAGTVVGSRATAPSGESAPSPHLDYDPDRQLIVAGSDRQTAGSRFLAGCVDCLPALFVGILLTGTGLAMISLAADTTVDSAVLGDGPMLLLFACSTAAYHPLLTTLVGTTPGQRLLNLRIAAPDGTAPAGASLSVKYLLRPLDYVLFPITAIAILTTAQKQRPSELLAGTVVGRAKPSQEETDAETERAQPSPERSEPTSAVD